MSLYDQKEGPSSSTDKVVTVPQVLVAVRVALGVCWATLVAAELIAARRGLGAMIQDSANFFRIDDIYAGIILIGLNMLWNTCCLPITIPLLVVWMKPETKRWYGVN